MATTRQSQAPARARAQAQEEEPATTENVRIESLAVKYRPKLLTDLVGQGHIATQILGMLKRKRFPSTMLLNGESGCGKTTTARIIARYLLCRNPDPETQAPCGECPSCRYGDGHPDISEINMAEARGIDDVRALIQSSRSMPTVGNYRVFIVDECFPGDTEVEVTDGVFVTLQDIVTYPEKYLTTLSLNVETLEVEQKQITARMPKVAGAGRMVRVHLSDGSYQDCTEDHPWWSDTEGRMVEARHLEPGTALFCK